MNKPLPPIAESAQTLQIQLRTETGPKKRSRLQALYLLARGHASSRWALANLMAVHRHTTQRWLKLYEGGGRGALLTIKKAPGNRPSLPPLILTNLQARLNQNRGFSSYGEMRQYLARVHKLPLAYSTVHKLVRYRLPAKPKAPRRSPPKKSLRAAPGSRPRALRSSKRA